MTQDKSDKKSAISLDEQSSHYQTLVDEEYPASDFKKVIIALSYYAHTWRPPYNEKAREALSIMERLKYRFEKSDYRSFEETVSKSIILDNFMNGGGHD